MARTLGRAGLAVGLIAAVIAGVGGGVPPAASLPAGFTDSLVTNVGTPTAVAGGANRLYITTQGGTIRVYRDGALLATPALAIPSGNICATSERGLLGIALDPTFPSTPRIYVYYTANIANVGCKNHVSRFDMQAGSLDVVNPSSEVILFDRIQSTAGNHNAGDLNFGKDGMLYVSIGDGGCDYNNDSGCAGANDAARDPHAAVGKIMRINPLDGSVPAGNPFPNVADKCRDNGLTTSGQFCPETFAWGLRNPFRFTMDPNTAPGVVRFFINDVGQGAWEEIDESAPAADYGWNVREGHCANGSTTNCGAPPAGMTNPIYDYGRGGGSASITGGAFVPNNTWGVAYNGSYLFADYVCGKIFRRDASGVVTEFQTGLGDNEPVHLEFVGSALYYTTYEAGGSLRVITPQATNGAPTASMTASPTSGTVPLTVTFNGSASTDPESEPLQYIWSWGDGTPGQTTSTATTSHVYNTTGTFLASLNVRDTAGNLSAAPATRQITVTGVGNRLPTVEITSPSPSTEFAVGQNVTVTASASDPDGDPVTLTWKVDRRHNAGTPASHVHPWASTNSFAYPAPEDLAAVPNSWIEVTVTASDGNGGTATDFQMLLPNIVNVTLASTPVGTTVSFNGSAGTAPATYTSWQGWHVTLTATTPVGYRFQRWTLGGKQTQTFTTPASDVTNTVTWAKKGKR